MNKIKSLFLATVCVCTVVASSPAPAQTIAITGTSLSNILQLAGLSAQLANNQLVQVGVPFTLNGNQTFLITTNSAGLYTITTSGPGGTNSFTPPSTLSSALATSENWVAANNPANIGYYATNEIEARVGVMYLQNSGEAAAVLSVQKYGWFGFSNWGVGAGILQGNKAGQSGTAAYYGEVDYRKPIGDVSAIGGLVGGYDKWNSTGFIGAKAGLEYRQSAHLGEFLDVVYAYESGQSDRGLMIGGGITYAF